MQRPLQPSELVGRYALVGMGGDISRPIKLREVKRKKWFKTSFS